MLIEGLCLIYRDLGGDCADFNQKSALEVADLLQTRWSAAGVPADGAKRARVNTNANEQLGRLTSTANDLTGDESAALAILLAEIRKSTAAP
jgi:hypothetical protein